MATNTEMDIHGISTPVVEMNAAAQTIDTMAAQFAASGMAPSGYGWGENNCKVLTSADDLNTLVGNGFYTWAASAPFGAPLSYCKMLNWSHSRYKTQISISYVDAYKHDIIMRTDAGSGTFGEWEHTDPPMQLGTEYRTTERHNGKPVYVRRIELPALAVGTESSPARTDISSSLLCQNCAYLVRHDMFIYPSNGGGMHRLPAIDDKGKMMAMGSLNQSNVSSGEVYLYGSIYSFRDLSSYKASVTAWYTKTTD